MRKHLAEQIVFGTFAVLFIPAAIFMFTNGFGFYQILGHTRIDSWGSFLAATKFAFMIMSMPMVFGLICLHRFRHWHRKSQQQTEESPNQASDIAAGRGESSA